MSRGEDETTPKEVRQMVDQTLHRLLSEAGVAVRRPRRTQPPDTLVSRIQMIRQRAEMEAPKPPRTSEA